MPSGYPNNQGPVRKKKLLFSVLWYETVLSGPDNSQINNEGESTMTKRILSLLTALLLLLLPLSFAGADEATPYDTYYDSTYNANMFSTPHTGIVICNKMNLRPTASTSGSTLASISNGMPVKILGITTNNQYYLVDLESCGVSGKGTVGYGKAGLIKIDPYFVATTKYTLLYATPWSAGGLRNGEQNNRFFLVLAEQGGWYAVQEMTSSPGTSFIRTGDVGRYTQTAGTTYVVTWKAPVYDENSWNRIQDVERYTPATFAGSAGDYTLLIFNEGKANEFRAWILSQYTALVIN